MLKSYARRWLEIYLGSRGSKIVRVEPEPYINDLDVFRTVCDLLLRLRPDCDIIQIGANDGMLADPIYQLLQVHRQNRAILVEPLKWNYEKLVKNYGNRENTFFEFYAVSDFEGVRRIYYFEDAEGNLPGWARGVVSLESSVLESHLKVPGMRELFPRPVISSIEIDVFRYEHLLSKYSVSDIGLLQVDTEGHDAIIVSSALEVGAKPSIIQFEHSHLSQQVLVDLYNKIRENGYQIQRMMHDTIAIRIDLSDLR